MPLQGGLINLWNAVEICAQQNSDAALFTFGAVAMNMDFQILVDLKEGSPVILYGEPDVSKTTIANTAMSILSIEVCRVLWRTSYFLHFSRAYV